MPDNEGLRREPVEDGPTWPVLAELARSARRHPFVGLAAVGLCASGAVLYLRVTPPRYACSPAVVEISGDTTGVATVAEATGRTQISMQALDTHVHHLHSRSVLDRARRLLVAEHPELGDLDLAGGLRASPVTNTFLLHVTFESERAEINPLAANAIAHAFVAEMADVRRRRTASVAGSLDERLASLTGDRARLERELTDARAALGVVDVAGETSRLERLVSDLDQRTHGAELAVVAARAAHDEGVAAEAAGALASAPFIAAAPVLRDVDASITAAERDRAEVLQEFTERSPFVRVVDERLAELRARRAELISGLVLDLARDVDNAAGQLTELRRMRDARRAELAALVEKGAEERRLTEARASVTRAITELDRMRVGLDESGGADLPSVTLWEEAVEIASPVSPNVTRVWLVAAFAAVIAGLGVPALAGRVAPRLHGPDDVRRAGGPPVIGSIPPLSGNGVSPAAACAKTDAADLCDARRRMVVRVVRSGPARRIAVVPATRGAGASVTSVALAAGSVEIGRDTVLVEGSARRAVLSRALHVRAAGPPPGALLRQDGLPQVETVAGPIPLHVVAAGSASTGGGQADPRRLAEILDEIALRHDALVIDCAAIDDDPDTALLCAGSDAVLVVVRAGRTRPAELRATLRHLASLGVQVRGVVLNGVGGAVDVAPPGGGVGISAVLRTWLGGLARRTGGTAGGVQGAAR